MPCKRIRRDNRGMLPTSAWTTGRTTDSVGRMLPVHIADLVLRNGHVFDGRTHLPGHALAVADGRVLAVVPDTEIDAYAAPGAEVVDLAGGLVLPGFQDAHVHPVQGGVERMRCDLT